MKERIVLAVGVTSTLLGALLLIRLVQTSASCNQQLLPCPDSYFLFLPLGSGFPFLFIGIGLVASSLVWSHLHAASREKNQKA